MYVEDLEAVHRLAGLLAHWLHPEVSGSYLFFRGLSVSATGQHDRTSYSSLCLLDTSQPEGVQSTIHLFTIFTSSFRAHVCSSNIFYSKI